MIKITAIVNLILTDLIAARKIKKLSDKSAYLGIEESVPERVGSNKLVNENRLSPTNILKPLFFGISILFLKYE